MINGERAGRILLATMALGLAACDSSTGPEPFLECSRVGSIANGDTKNGSLSTSDCELPDGSYVDFYRFTLASSQTVTITMRSSAVDSYLLLFNDAETPLDSDDDSGGGLSGTDSQIVILLPAGNYVIAANSFDVGEIGAYTISLSH